jgi:glycosyltransferase involved in cell wall biosynthesis
VRILVIAPQPFYTERGTPIAVRAMAEALAAAGHGVDLLVFHAGEDVRMPAVRIVRAGRPRLVRKVPIGPSWQKLLCDIALYRVAARLVRERRYDVVHGVEEGAFIAERLARQRGIGFVYDMDSLMSEQLRDKGFPFSLGAPVFDALERRALRRAAGTVAVCPALVEHAGRHARGPVHLLPDFPLPGVEDAAPDQEVLAIEGFRFVYVGNLESYQGIDLMLEAFAGACGLMPGARLVIIGGGAGAVERCRARVRALADAGRAVFLGSRPPQKLGGILAASDVLVSPRTHGRNTPMKLYSYLASGKPVLATRLQTHTQVMDDSTGVLVEATRAAMGEGMRRLHQDSQLRTRLGEAGRALALGMFGRERFAQRLAAFYQEVSGGIGLAGPGGVHETEAVSV